MMAKALLINPSYQPSYGGAKASIVNPIHPTLGLATIAAVALERGHEVDILDMSWRAYDFKEIADEVRKKKPDIVGISATTPLMNQLRDISVLIKELSKELGKDILVVGGGAHPSSLPIETLKETLLDIVFVGEADFSFAEICDGRDLKDVKGIYYRDGNKIATTGFRVPIENLDDLPTPAWHLYDLREYKRISRLIAKRPPVTMAEFSRGCVFECDFCASKMTMARGYRKKSPERCALEVKRMYELGFREFMLADDIFTSDQKWAIAVCEAIIKAGVDMAWSCTNGIRVESADLNLFQKLRAAGCYRVSFGFESGNDEVLKRFGKGGQASIQQGRVAVRDARSAGIDTNGFFLLGLSPDTEESMMDTIGFARLLPLDMMKFGVSVAFPGTPMFHDYVRKDLIRSYNWDDYFIYTDEPLFSHEHLTYDVIQKYMALAYRRAILFNPGFIVRRLIRGFRTGEFFWDLYYSVRFFLLPAIGEKIQSDYYARDRWPKWDFKKNPPQELGYQVVRKPAPKAKI
ncbi:MAG: cobalamin B12-binding domain-containing protein [Rhodospirillales bacterium]|nr:cobalamin B12-binding domain-containing protein [Rhodospirillales bacterium]